MLVLPSAFVNLCIFTWREKSLMKLQAPKHSAPRPQAEPALNQKQIVQAALQLLDEVGFEGLTMRNLAKKLGIKAASLYWHMRDKEELLSLLADEICEPMREPDRTLSWQDQLEILGNEFRRVLLAHRDAARVLASSGAPSGPNILRLTEILLRTLLDAGFSSKDAAYAGFMLNDFIVMFVSEETQFAHVPAESAAAASYNAKNWFKALPPDQYPSVIALADDLVESDSNERFKFGIMILRSGLESCLAHRKARNQI